MTQRVNLSSKDLKGKNIENPSVSYNLEDSSVHHEREFSIGVYDVVIRSKSGTWVPTKGKTNYEANVVEVTVRGSDGLPVLTSDGVMLDKTPFISKSSKEIKDLGISISEEDKKEGAEPLKDMVDSIEETIKSKLQGS